MSIFRDSIVIVTCLVVVYTCGRIAAYLEYK
jgi:hypothetical protein